MKVKVAIARKILVAIWHMLSEGVSYRDYKKPDVQTDGNSYTAYCKASSFVVVCGSVFQID